MFACSPLCVCVFLLNLRIKLSKTCLGKVRYRAGSYKQKANNSTQAYGEGPDETTDRTLPNDLTLVSQWSQMLDWRRKDWSSDCSDCENCSLGTWHRVVWRRSAVVSRRSATSVLHGSRFRQQLLQKRWQISTSLHGGTIQSTVIFSRIFQLSVWWKLTYFNVRAS